MWQRSGAHAAQLTSDVEHREPVDANGVEFYLLYDVAIIDIQKLSILSHW